jgi:hypothetical protein
MKGTVYIAIAVNSGKCTGALARCNNIVTIKNHAIMSEISIIAEIIWSYALERVLDF